MFENRNTTAVSPTDINLLDFDDSVLGENRGAKSSVDPTHASQHVVSDVNASDESQWIAVCRRQKRKDPMFVEKVKLPSKSLRRQRRRQRRQRARRVTEVSAGVSAENSPGIVDADDASMPNVSTSSSVETANSHPALPPIVLPLIEESKDKDECNDTALVTSSPSVGEVLPNVYGSVSTFDEETEIVFDQVGNEFASVPAWTDDETAFAIDFSSIQGNDLIAEATSFEMYEEIERDLIRSMLNSVANHGSCGIEGNELCCNLVVGGVGDNLSSANHDGVLFVKASLVGQGDNIDLCNVNAPALSAASLPSNVLKRVPCPELTGRDDDESSKCPFIPDTCGETLLTDDDYVKSSQASC